MPDPEEPPLWEGFEYTVDHTPWGVAQGGDLVVSLRESDDGRHTRRLLRWHSGVRDGTRGISIALVHQRRRPQTGEWVDEHFDLRALRAGEEVALELDQEQTRSLRTHLNNLFQINDLLQENLDDSYRVYPTERAPLPADVTTAVQHILRAEPDAEAVVEAFEQLAPNLTSSAWVIHQHRLRRAATEEFEEHVGANDWMETAWQRFFEDNDWIFGHGLAYRFLVTEQPQPAYGGADVTGVDGQEGDFLLASRAGARFSVLVEIKKPDTPLLGGRRYRNGAWRPSTDLVGGVAQLQTNCQQWEQQSRHLPNIDWANAREIVTAQPRGILLIGHLGSLTARHQRESFERFRRNLWNPEVLTYDELLERARFIVERTAPDSAQIVDEDYPPEPEDLPF